MYNITLSCLQIIAQAPEGMFSKEVVYIGGGTLVTAMGIIWKMFTDLRAKTDARSDAQETRLVESEGRLLEFSEKIGELNGRIGLAEDLHPKVKSIESLSTQVLTIVTQVDARQRKDNAP